MPFTTTLRRTLVCAALACVALAGGAGVRGAAAQVQFDVRFVDPTGLYTPYYADLTRTVQAAGTQWASRVVTASGPVNVGVRLTFDPSISTANGTSAASSYVGLVNGLSTYRFGFASELATGIDPNGAADDVLFTVGTGYLANTLWFDPDPNARLAPVPAYRIDAMSVFMHEFGHALAFNGWRDWTTGRLPGGYQSTFDQWVTFDAAGTPYFTGPRAQAVYGGPVPLTYGNLMHVGNAFPRPGADLVPDLMNGVVYYYQRRYDISALDLAIAADAGVTLTPEPGPLALVGVALVLLPAAGWRGRRARTS